MKLRRTDLILAAASGLAREAMAVAEADGRFRVAGVVDDDPQTWGTECAGHEVVGGLDRLTAHPTAKVVVCAGRGIWRHRMVLRLAELGVDDARFATLIDPSVRIGRGSVVGAGSILLPGVVLTADVRVGRHVVVMPNAVLTHDDVVEDYATICAGVTLAGNVRVATEAYLGASCAVRERTVIGAGATVGMGAVVIRDIPAGEIWAGTPASPLGTPSARRIFLPAQEERTTH